MTEFIKQNNHPLNQTALRLLKQWAKPDDEFLYSLQLAQRAIWRKEDGLLRGEREDVLEMVECLLLEDPKQAMDYLLTNGEGDLVLNTTEVMEQESPSQLAQHLTIGIRTRMRAEAP